jgi:hypothetical protein
MMKSRAGCWPMRLISLTKRLKSRMGLFKLCRSKFKVQIQGVVESAIGLEH